MIGNLAEPLDVVGIGVGPFNLSLAALLAGAPDVSALFLEGKPAFSWHPGLLFDSATLQSPQVKDLVTLADPTSPYSFLNYLRRQQRLYRFIVADYKAVRRKEFSAYCRWVSESLDTLAFSSQVDRIGVKGDLFVVHSGERRILARNLALGVGRPLNVPAEFAPHLGPTVFHGGDYLTRTIPDNARVLVVGGGQTGAEIFHDLLTRRHGIAALTWSSRRHNFIPFDESPFANELYVPGFTKSFVEMRPDRRAWLLDRQKHSSDAILQGLLEAIYRRLYEMEFLEGGRDHVRLLTDQHIASVRRIGSAWRVETRSSHDARVVADFDVVILATGYRFEFPTVLEPLASRMALDEQGNFLVNPDFSIVWDGAPDRRIFVHNAALHSHGWIDPNFAGMAWRSATMINALAGREVYDLRELSTAVDWAVHVPASAQDGLAGSTRQAGSAAWVP
jgi:lysine N6-hydroxylase